MKIHRAPKDVAIMQRNEAGTIVSESSTPKAGKKTNKTQKDADTRPSETAQKAGPEESKA